MTRGETETTGSSHVFSRRPAADGDWNSGAMPDRGGGLGSRARYASAESPAPKSTTGRNALNFSRVTVSFSRTSRRRRRRTSVLDERESPHSCFAGCVSCGEADVTVSHSDRGLFRFRQVRGLFQNQPPVCCTIHYTRAALRLRVPACRNRYIIL